MATRRPPSARDRATNTMLPPSNRPRSALAKSREDHPDPSSSLQKHFKSTHPEDSEINIQVVIRCRRRSDREIQDNSPIIVSSSGAKSHDVTIETSNPVSSLGVVTLPPTRTYPFDLVFGPEADQAMIYHNVVSPMLDEVLMGYNCTLFAYGQTGTGKTYTMQGDLSPTPMGNPSAQAGMIPRVLFRLFHNLETTAADYSVKVSFVELYNEELRDLLANELSPPTGTVQPMGMGSGAASKDTNGGGGLKIFDDVNKRGVFIQGLEEVCVKDASDALALLTKGSERRQIAATKFNDHSSRSHSVFSITVHLKETSNMGDDLLKIGKLNLVDLAGSENIGRSGAENKRAREAGMINQSLLTLGRVINALVDKSSHVPYRESKLTRLLQDSLGGRTKTCIIATVSPARSNMEETLSTLEYAIRAKNIRNKPELNQRMTRNSLLKEYVAEIERLKADVLAAREKNGIFFSEETWNQLSAEQELRQTELEEAKKQVEIVESQMLNVREEFDQSIALLRKRDAELREMKGCLKDTAEELEMRLKELRDVKDALEDEVLVRQAYQENETKLDEVARGLRKTAKESVRDVGGLFDKLHRKTLLFRSNTNTVTAHSELITAETNKLYLQLQDFIKHSSQSSQKLRISATQFQSKELGTLTAHSERVDAQLQRIKEALAVMQEKEESSDDSLALIRRVVTETHENLKSGFDAWGDAVKKSCEVVCHDVETNYVLGFSTVEKALKGIGSIFETMVREVQDYMDSERKSVLQADALADTTVNAEVARLRQQNEMLTQLLETERAQGERAKDELIQRVSGLFAEFTKGRDQRLTESVAVIQGSNAKAEEGMRAFGDELVKVTTSMAKKRDKAIGALEKRSGDGKRTRDGALKTLKTARATFTDELNKMQGSVSNSVQGYSAQIHKQTKDTHATCTDAFDRHARAKRVRLDASNAMNAEVQSEYRYLQRGLASTSRNIESMVGRVVSEGNGLAELTDKYHKAASAGLSAVKDATQTVIEQGVQEDVPTGTTPRKRAFEFVDQWQLTKSRETILRVSKEKPIPSGGNDENLLGPNESDEHEPPAADMVREVSPDGPDMLRASSPIAVSLASSVSSCSETPRPKPPQKGTRGASQKSGIPTTGTLTDRPTNIITHRRTRRVR